MRLRHWLSDALINVGVGFRVSGIKRFRVTHTHRPLCSSKKCTCPFSEIRFRRRSSVCGEMILTAVLLRVYK